MPYITCKTITETFLERVKTTPNTVGFIFKPTYAEAGPPGPPTAPNQWKRVTFQQFYNETKIISFGLMGLGINPGDKIVILSDTRYEWSACDMAILGSGAITIPVYASNTPSDVAYILNHSGARVAFLENVKQLKKILDYREKNPQGIPNLERVILIEPSATGQRDVMTLQGLKELGRREEAKKPTKFDDYLINAKSDDVITICYTSGTTGIPKGVVLTHDNMMSVLEDCVATIGKYVKPEAELLVSFLPFSHVLGKVESMAIYTFGWQEVFAENLDKLMTNIEEMKPTILFAVPRIFEKAHARIHSTIEELTGVKKKLFNWALSSGRKYYSSVWSRKKPSLKEKSDYALAKKLVFRKISKKFGGRLKFAVCGGAPLPSEIGQFFSILGIKVLEGYGLTETCAPVTLNLPSDTRYGTVGRPLPEVTLKIADDGEILVKSRKVFKGYLNMPEETNEVLKGGWFYTGDIGHIDSDGFLHITDRKKDLIATSGGKKVAPQKIENLAKSHKMISQFVVYGERKNYLTALITLDKEQTIRWASEHQILFSEFSELIKHPKIIALVQSIIDEINQHLASYETIKKFLIIEAEFSVESGELTPSMKVRRDIINKHYKAELDQLYSPT